MANRKDLKKDINYLASEVIMQGLMKLTLMDTVKDEDVSPLLGKAVEMRNEFIARANHPDGKDNPKIVKKYYTKLRADLMSTTMDLLEKIQELK